MNSSNDGNGARGSYPNTRMNSSDWYVFLLVVGFHAQLPVWLSLCASARYALLLWRDSSARLRSSMSIPVPYHLTISPVSSRSGTLRCRNQRYSPSARLTRDSATKGSPDATDARHLSTNSSTSSGWIAVVQRQPRRSVRERPTYSCQPSFRKSRAPSGSAV